MNNQLKAKCPICQHADQAYVIEGQGGNFMRFQCGRCKDFVVSVNASPRLAADPARAGKFAAISSQLPTDRLLLITAPDPKFDQQGSGDALSVLEEPTANWMCDSRSNE